MIPDTKETLNNLPESESQKKYVKFHQHLSTTFIMVGIVSFTLGAVVNWLTIKRLYNHK